MSKNFSFDIFELLDAITSGDEGYIDTLTPAQLKGFSPFVIQKWLKNSDVNISIIIR